MKSRKGYILVLVQVISGGFLVITTCWSYISQWAILLVAFSVFLMIWSVIAIRIDNFNIVPAPVTNGELTTHGPYRLIRHPMYSSVLLVSITLISDQFSLERLLCGFVIAVDLWIKLKYEEKLLLQKYPDYRSYCKVTKHLIPFII
jgi:protein-S-isoprenylcysteine O-methyltransferase Ste14